MSKINFETKVGFTREFLSQVRNLRACFWLSCSANLLLSEEEGRRLLDTRIVGFQDGDHSIIGIGSKEIIRAGSPNILDEYIRYCTRNVAIFCYEGFKLDQIRYEAVEKENWFKLLWFLRLAFAHGFNCIWEIKEELVYERNFDRKKITIKREWNGRPMTVNDIGGSATIIDLLELVCGYVESKTI